MDYDGPDTLPLQPLLGPPLRVSPPQPRRPWSERLRSAAQTYLMVGLLAMAAILTWWLVKQTPIVSPASAEKPLSHVPDYEMRGFSVQHYTQAGPARGVIEGDAVRHYPDTDTLEIDGVRIRWTDGEGRVLRASAQQATADNRSGEIWLRGGARVVQEPADGGGDALEFTGERMLFDTRNGVVVSREPVRLQQGPHHFEAGSIRYEHDKRTAVLGQGVKGRMEPGHSRNARP